MPPDFPLCFVLMPFGLKPDPAGGPSIDFEPIYEQAIQPAIEAAGMEALRADEERTGGIIHKPMFERLLLCDFAVADLTTGNPNVFYELGVRHAARPYSTLTIFAANQKLPFDVNYLRSFRYELGANNSFTSIEAEILKKALTARLGELRKLATEEGTQDSPVFQLLEGYGAPDIARLKTDVFRDRVRYSNERKRQLANARDKNDPAEMNRIEQNLGSLDSTEAGVLIDLLLSYRSAKAWASMISLYDRMPASLQRTIMVREQYAFALNRLGRWREAVEILEEVIVDQGPSSETYGILGRVYKDLWSNAEKAGDAALAEGHLHNAIDRYLRGFEADWRDSYPGINAVTLLDIQGNTSAQSKKAELLPLVTYAVKQRIKTGKPDYWDYATLLELAVLDSEEGESRTRLADALAHVREPWEPETTANNLAMIAAARKKRGVKQAWLDEVIASLKPRSSAPAS